MGSAGRPAQTSPPGRVAGLGLTLLIASLVPVLIALHGRPDVDLWLHLRIGEFLTAGGRFGAPDPFTTLADTAYRPTQWLAEVAGSWVWGWAGMPGIQILRLVGVLAIVAATWAAGRAVAGPLAAAGATLLTVFASAAGWGERPQLLGLALLALATWVWWRALARGRAPWLLVPLTWVWAGVHGTWAIGIALGLAMTLVAVVDEHRGQALAARFLAVTVASLAAAALTPLGPRLLLDPLTVGAAVAGRVNEWQPPGLTNPLLVALLLGVLATLGAWAGRRQLLPGRIVLLAAATAMAFSAVRLLAVAAILIAPLLAEALSGRSPRPEVDRSERRHWAIAATVAIAGGLWIALAQPHPEPVVGRVAAAVRALPDGAVVAVDPRVVGWVEWAAPDVRVLRDLRSELYAARTADAYEEFLHGAPEAADYARRQGATVALLAPGSPLVTRLGAAGWTEAERDAEHVLVVAPR